MHINQLKNVHSKPSTIRQDDWRLSQAVATKRFQFKRLMYPIHQYRGTCAFSNEAYNRSTTMCCCWKNATKCFTYP